MCSPNTTGRGESYSPLFQIREEASRLPRLPLLLVSPSVSRLLFFPEFFSPQRIRDTENLWDLGSSVLSWLPVNLAAAAYFNSASACSKSTRSFEPATALSRVAASLMSSMMSSKCSYFLTLNITEWRFPLSSTTNCGCSTIVCVSSIS